MYRYLRLLFILITFSLLGCSPISESQTSRGLSSIDKQFGNDVMWYIGSFDPPTMGHISIVKELINRTNGPIYITVNHNSGKNFNSSIRERVAMLALAFKDHENVHILREPIEGRRSFVQEVSKRHDKNIVLAVGEDVLEKNYEMLGDMSNLSFLSFLRAGQETDYIPKGIAKVITDEVDGKDGISSSVVRRKIIRGESLEELVLPEIAKSIKDLGLYTEQGFDQQQLLAEFKSVLNKQLPHLKYREWPSFTYKDTQSKGGQIDAMIRWMLKSGEIPSEHHGLYISLVETFFKEEPLALSIYKNKKVGVFLGTFDPVSKGVLEAIKESIEKLELDKLYLSPFYSSKKIASYSVEERISFLEAAIEELSKELREKVEIIPGKDLQSSVNYFKAVSVFEDTLPIAIFGENVIERNFDMLNGRVALDYAVIQRSKKLSSQILDLVSNDNIIQVKNSNTAKLTDLVSQKLRKVRLLKKEAIDVVLSYYFERFGIIAPAPQKEMSVKGLGSYIKSYMEASKQLIPNQKIVAKIYQLLGEDKSCSQLVSKFFNLSK